MSARIANRRHLRSAAATTVVAAVAGTVLMPLSAYAASVEDSEPVLRIEMGAPVPSGPLTRGGASETFSLTVTNPSGKAAPFHPWLLGNVGSPISLKKSDVVFKVEEVNAPDTASFIGQQDGGWQGVFYPVGKKISEGFEVPANSKLSWKVTVGLGESYPVNSNAFELRAATTSREIAPGGDASLTFKATPSTKPAEPAKLKNHFENNGSCDGTNDESLCKQLTLWYQHEGGPFTSDLVTRLTVKVPSDVKNPDVQVRVMTDGKWTDVRPDRNGDFMLPFMPKDFQSMPGDMFALQVRLGPKTQITSPTLVTLQAGVALAEYKPGLISSATTDFKLAPAKPATTKPANPTPQPSATASPTKTSVSPSSSTSSSSITPVTAPAGNTPKATGSLAHTGSDSRTGLYAGLAAALVALGAGITWLGARRRSSSARV